MMPGAAERFAGPIGNDALQREQSGKDQERAQHVGILEGSAGALIQRQQVVPAGDEVEVAGDARCRRNQRADDQAAAQHVQPRRGIFGDHLAVSA
jgi:hypothetical protein